MLYLRVLRQTVLTQLLDDFKEELCEFYTVLCVFYHPSFMPRYVVIIIKYVCRLYLNYCHNSCGGL